VPASGLRPSRRRAAIPAPPATAAPRTTRRVTTPPARRWAGTLPASLSIAMRGIERPPRALLLQVGVKGL